MAKIKLRKGLDLKLFGEAKKGNITTFISNTYALKPTDFIGVFPKLLVKEGDYVKAGSPVFYDKYRDDILFSSPVSGKISEIKRGKKRLLEEIRIESDSEIDYLRFEIPEIDNLNRDSVKKALLESGIWATIRQRPYSTIANPDDIPKSIFISAFDTSPLAPDYDFIIDQDAELFQTGINILKFLTDGKIHLNVHSKKTTSDIFHKCENVQVNTFSGPHPSGNIGIQIHHIEPINKGDIVWYINPQHIITIARLFAEKIYNSSRIISLCGSEVKNPEYYKILAGASINDITKDNINNGDLRYISGNVLSGESVRADSHLGFYDSQLCIIPEGNFHEFLGWAMPGLKKASVSRTFLNWLTPNKHYKLNTNINGGERAFVLSGLYEKVLPIDILPVHLIKAIMVEDIELMEKLGIYEIDEEDFALCEFICPSKIEVQSYIRKGLDLIRKEMS